jgi:hypothetical protein
VKILVDTKTFTQEIQVSLHVAACLMLMMMMLIMKMMVNFSR